MTCNLTCAGSKFAGRQAYLPECAGEGSRIVTVEMALPSAINRCVRIVIPPRENTVSKSGSKLFGVFNGFWSWFRRRWLFPREYFGDRVDRGVGEGETKSPGIWSWSSKSRRFPWYQKTYAGSSKQLDIRHLRVTAVPAFTYISLSPSIFTDGTESKKIVF